MVTRNTRISIFAVCVCVFFAKTKTSKREKVQCVQTIKSPLIINRPINQPTSPPAATAEAVSGHEAHSCLTTYFHSPFSRRQHTQSRKHLARTYLIHQTAAIRRLLFTHKVPLIVRAAYILLNSAAAAAWYTQHHPLYLFKYTASSNH